MAEGEQPANRRTASMWRPTRKPGGPVLREALASKWPRAFSMFASWDDANTGYVSKPEFRKAVAMLGIVASRTDVEGIFDSFDPDRDGSIEYRQLGEELMNEDHAPPPAPPAALKAKAQLKDRMVQRLSTAADLFRQWDSDGNGLIDKAEFRKAVAALGIEASDEACDLAFDDYDHDGSGEMSYTEYVRYSLRDALKRSAARVMDLFRKWDEDRSGCIDRNEFVRAIRSLRFEVPRAELDLLFDEMDADGSGQVDFKEANRVLRQGASIRLSAELRVGAAGAIEVGARNTHSLRSSSAACVDGVPAPPRGPPTAAPAYSYLDHRSSGAPSATHPGSIRPAAAPHAITPSGSPNLSASERRAQVWRDASASQRVRSVDSSGRRPVAAPLAASASHQPGDGASRRRSGADLLDLGWPSPCGHAPADLLFSKHGHPEDGHSSCGRTRPAVVTFAGDGVGEGDELVPEGSSRGRRLF